MQMKQQKFYARIYDERHEIHIKPYSMATTRSILRFQRDRPGKTLHKDQTAP